MSIGHGHGHDFFGSLLSWRFSAPKVSKQNTRSWESSPDFPNKSRFVWIVCESYQCVGIVRAARVTTLYPLIAPVRALRGGFPTLLSVSFRGSIMNAASRPRPSRRTGSAGKYPHSLSLKSIHNYLNTARRSTRFIYETSSNHVAPRREGPRLFVHPMLAGELGHQMRRNPFANLGQHAKLGSSRFAAHGLLLARPRPPGFLLQKNYARKPTYLRIPMG